VVCDRSGRRVRVAELEDGDVEALSRLDDDTDRRPFADAVRLCVHVFGVDGRAAD